MNKIKDYINEGKIDAAMTLCKNNDTPYARMIEKGISVSGYGYQNKAFMRKAKAQNVEVRNQNAA